MDQVYAHRGAGPGRGGLCRLRRPLQLHRRPRHPSRGAVAVPDWVGSDQERWVELAGDRLMLSASPLLTGKQQRSTTHGQRRQDPGLVAGPRP